MTKSFATYKRVALKPQHPAAAASIAAEFQLSPLAARVLAARGFKADAILNNFLDPTLKGGLPHPGKLKNIENACALTAETIRQKKSIAICCDFDVDGLTGGAQLHHFLNTLGAVNRVFVPDRFADGYGLNSKTVEAIAREGFALLIAIDFGTTNFQELNKAKACGLKTLVIDHHHLEKKDPPCDVFINPEQPGCGFADKLLCSAGLVWYFITALKECLKQELPAAAAVDARAYLDLACLGTICDMVPLTGVNRVLAKRGLELLSCTKRTGLVALKNAASLHKAISCYDVSFALGPRINAAGRMVRGDVVIDLLTTDDSSKAEKIAAKLNRLNLERQETEQALKLEALSLLQAQYAGQPLPAALVIWGEDFHTGVIGLVAQRLTEQMYKPAIVLGKDSAGIFKGSARGIPGLNVVEALAAVSKHLVKYGGHEGAGGVTIEEDKLEAFKLAFIKECERRLKAEDLAAVVQADALAGLAEVDLKLVDEFKAFEPFGMGNPSPQLLVRDLKVVNVKDIKQAHLKATLSDGQHYLSAMLWRQTFHPALVKDQRVDAVFKPSANTFNGITELQASLQAVEKAS